jgi:integrase
LVVQALQVHRRAQAAARLAATYWHDEGLVLTNGVGGLVEPRTLSRAWEEWAKAAGVEDTGTHLGRHYAATSLLASGAASVADVAALLGHDPAVLLNTYATAVAAGQGRRWMFSGRARLRQFLRQLTPRTGRRK